MRMIAQLTDSLYRSRRRIATAAVASIIGMLAVHVIFGANGMIVYQQKRTQYKDLNTELQNLQQENEKLGQRIKALKTDSKTIEKEAREQLRYVRPGEVVYSIPAEKPAAALTTAQK